MPLTIHNMAKFEVTINDRMIVEAENENEAKEEFVSKSIEVWPERVKAKKLSPNKQPKFKKGEEVVYHAGNWKYIVSLVLWDENGDVWYHLDCNEEECEKCDPLEEKFCSTIHSESDLIGYEEWCDHSEEGTCKTCCN